MPAKAVKADGESSSEVMCQSDVDTLSACRKQLIINEEDICMVHECGPTLVSNKPDQVRS